MKRYLTEKEVCEMLTVSKNTVRKYFAECKIHIGRRIVYDRYEIERRMNGEV